MIDNITNKKKALWMLVIIIAAMFLYFNYLNRQQADDEASFPDYPIYNDDGTVTLPLNAVGYGVRDPETKEIINPGSVVIPVEDKVRFVLDIEQNMPEEKEYLLIVLKNNEQCEYTLNNERYSSFQFRLAKQEERFYNIEIEINKDIDKEISFVYFENPDYKNTEINSDDDLFAVLPFSRAYSIKILLYGDAVEHPVIRYSEEAKTINYENRVRDIYLSRDLESLTILAAAESGEKVNAIISNKRDYEVDYALGSLLDWRQQSFPDGDMIKYIKVAAHSTKSYEITIPDVDQNTPYQVYVIPNVYITEEDAQLERGDLEVVASLRTVIAP